MNQTDRPRLLQRIAVLVIGVLGSSGARAITVDGRLDEPEWERAQRFTDFRVAEPYTLEPPRHPTEALLVSTPDGLLVGFICTQPPAESRPIAEQTPRDAYNRGDRVDVFIDFDGDATVAYALSIARAGSVQDGTVTNEREYSTDWDGDFSHAVQEGDEQWSVEILIP